ncbi:dihydrodipicolinate reductase [Acinetobacter sp. 2JN-4]|uniref:4-hydroxy-tetrahydrodipicolinate reductase n=1 Tax=Acinetobacter sp. 2JN-4 TaxID=2479844 RepID=UPI000EF9A8BC|nr:dihydrodipicolinate reductase C-terminal domain-containing protein [Acinetobacter sp. 2JN-4]RLZ07450.1 dihydrodipicolinate reductase [Acinetobacter sp. 2JN-4]
MKVGIMGFGKTGRAVASVLLESKRTSLQWVIRQSKQLEHRSVPEFLGVEADDPGIIHSKDEYSIVELLDRYPVDVIVDFSSEQGLDYYAEEAAKRGITIVSAVSQYPDERINQLYQLAESTCVLHSPNITIGINFLILAAKILKNIAPYTDIDVIEEHFKAKSEVSGTAKVIARELDLAEDTIKSVRAGGIVGVHEILFGFPFQTVRLKHESITREAFGNGILFAIENLKDKPKGFYSMEGLLLPFFKLDEPDSSLLINSNNLEQR